MAGNRYGFYYNFPDAKVISVIGDFNDWNPAKNLMHKTEEGIWYTEIELLPGQYRYKYLIDNTIRLNDPCANLYMPDEKGELASLIIINDRGERLVNEERYTVHINKYHLSDKVYEKEPEGDKKIFLPKDERVVVRLEFTNVTGVHTASILWYKPNGEFYYITENILWNSDKEKDKPIVHWFWINIDREGIPPGKWTFKFYIDGAFIFEDHFIIKNSEYYIENGVIKLR